MPAFSVVIPVKDGARYLEEVLGALAREADPEVLVIDSGSTDGSVEIARSAGVTLLEIPPEEFGHGRARNLGAERTSGELICFLTQDATPLAGWLDAYREAFELGERVGAAYGPHLPRPETSPMIARELTEFFAGFAPDGRPAVHRAGDSTFLSNVNACYRRECWAELRFRDVAYSEDQAFGRDMLAAGWAKVYHPGAAVEHAHDYGPVEFTRRYFDEYRGLRQATGHVEPFGVLRSARDVAALTRRDWRWMRTQGWSARRRVGWTGRAVAHHSGRKVFSALGSRSDKLPAGVRRAISLERRDDGADAVLPAPAEPRAVPLRIVARKLPHEYDAITRFYRDGAVPLLDPVPGMAERESLHVAVVIPPFARGSGGHGTIFQIVSRLERMGHTCSIWHYDPFGVQRSDWASRIRGDVNEFFSHVDAPVFKGFDRWYGADVVLATGWETVFPAMLLDGCRARAYLVNDYEPTFFATSVESLWSEETYRLGLHCIAASPWLRNMLHERFGASATDFQLGVDLDVYRPHPLPRRRDTVIFYSRTVTPRRAVPLGVFALEELHRRRPDVRVVMYGDHVKPLMTFEYEHLEVAKPAELATAYSEATVGLSLSLTNFSLVPKEMLACGLPCVELSGVSAESIFGEDGPLELAPPDPVAIADALERLLDDQALWERRSRAGIEAVRGHTWDVAAEQVEEGVREALRVREHAALPAAPAR